MLAAAREAFAEKGFDGATIRGIAATAGVDPALVHHYFGTKDALFLAAVEAPLDPADLVAGVLDGDRDELGERLVRMFLGVWEGPARGPGLALFRSAVAHDWSARLLRELLVTRVLRRVMAALDAAPDEREARAALVASQLAGVIMTRYLLRLEPIASASTEWLVATLAPTLQRYLTGDVVLHVQDSPSYPSPR